VIVRMIREADAFDAFAPVESWMDRVALHQE
jgi:hypothetical protein